MAAVRSKGMVLGVLLIAGVAGLGFGQVRGHVTADAVASFRVAPTAGQVVDTFTSANQPLYWGIGYEIIRHHIGFGGVYAVDFQRTTSADWWFDWYSQPFYVSYHLFGRRTLIDPFAGVGIGVAGRVDITPASSVAQSDSRVLLSIFPVLSAGLGLDLDGLYLSARGTYVPVISPPPVSPLENVPLGQIQVILSVGFSFGR